jgi:hypothetical protein
MTVSETSWMEGPIFGHAIVQKDDFDNSSACLHLAFCITFELSASAGDVGPVPRRAPVDGRLGFKRAQGSESHVDV